MARGKPWSESDVGFLERNVGHVTNSEIARFLGRTENAVKQEAVRRQLTTRRRREAWSPEEDHVLRTRYASYRVALLAEILKRTRKAVYDRAWVLGITRRSRVKMTHEERQIIRILYPTMPTRSVCEMVQRPPLAVQQAANRMGSKKVDRNINHPWRDE